MKNKANKKQITTRAVSKPAAVGYVVKRPEPKVNFRNDGTCLITHYEYVTDVLGATTVASISRVLNPQNDTVFTWLSAIATRFEMYRFKTLKMHYNPSTGTTTNGYVIIGFDFDMYDSVPTKVEMMAWKYSKKAPVWQACSLDISQDSRIAAWRYCNAGSVNQGDKRIDHLGLLTVLNQSVTDTNIGEVFIEYTVELRQPSYKVPPALYAKLPSLPSLMFSNPTVEGNMTISRVSDTTISVESIGNFLVSLTTTADANMSASPAITLQTPAFSPGSLASITPIVATHTATVANGLWQLAVAVAPIYLVFSGLTGGTNRLSNLRFSTYGKDIS